VTPHEEASPVDEERYQELLKKREESGLTGEEAAELGRLMAEKEGRGDEYANADRPPEEVEIARTGLAESEEEMEAVQEERAEREEEVPLLKKEVDDTPLDEEKEAAQEEDNPPVV
jgi:hypothetical protein